MRHHPQRPIILVLAILGAGTLLWAQAQAPPSPLPEQRPQVQGAPQQVWSPAQLDNLVAPIALYPDPLLGQLLVACTYPLEVVEANQWLQRNKNLSGQALVDAARQQSWDPSVQALVAVPDALAMLNQDIRWTAELGNAFLAQQADVMVAVQRMRARAQSSGNLSSTPQQTVTTQAEGGRQVIIIQPADPQVIYVPAYDPIYVWGPPVYGYYPPLYYAGFGFSFGHGFNFGFYYDGWGGWGGWGWGPNWSGNCVYVNHNFFRHYGFHDAYRGGYGGRTIWAHDSDHRHRAPYGNHQVADQFRGNSNASQNWSQGGSGSRVGGTPYANRYAERTGGQGYRSAAPQAQRFQNPPRQTYQAPQQYQSAPKQSRSAPQQYRSAPQQYQSAPQQSRSAPQQYRSAPQQYQSAPQQYRSAARQFQSAPRQYQSAPQQYQSAPQQYRSAPQQYRSAPQQYRSAPQQYRSAPQVSSPRVSGGSAGARVGFSGGASHGGGDSRGGGNRR